MPTTREIELERELRAQRDRADLLAAWLARYVIDYSVDHLPDCPQDECECPHATYLNRILDGAVAVEEKDDPSYLRGQLALAERDLRAAVEERRKSESRRLSLESAVHRHLDATLERDEVETIAGYGHVITALREENRTLRADLQEAQGALVHAEDLMRKMNDSMRRTLAEIQETRKKTAPRTG